MKRKYSLLVAFYLDRIIHLFFYETPSLCKETSSDPLSVDQLSAAFSIINFINILFFDALISFPANCRLSLDLQTEKATCLVFFGEIVLESVRFLPREIL